MASDLPDDLISLNEARDLLAICIRTLYGWIAKGQLRAWKRVGRLYVSRSELEDVWTPVEVARHPETFGERRRRDKNTRKRLAKLGLHELGP